VDYAEDSCDGTARCDRGLGHIAIRQRPEQAQHCHCRSRLQFYF